MGRGYQKVLSSINNLVVIKAFFEKFAQFFAGIYLHVGFLLASIYLFVENIRVHKVRMPYFLQTVEGYRYLSFILMNNPISLTFLESSRNSNCQ